MQKIGTDTYVFETNGHTALLAAGRLMLIDTGTDAAGSKLLPELEKTNYKPTDIEDIVITHTHPDHVGGLAKLKELSGARIASHKVEAKFISKEDTYQGPPGPGSQRHPGTPVDVMLEDGQEFEGLLVIHTPGHTPGHISLLDTERSLLFAGDSFRNDPSGFAPMPDKFNIDPDLHRTSIKRLADYNFEKVIFGHGDPVDSGAQEMFKNLLADL